MNQIRGAWGSRIGYIFSVAGSAVGLANIRRFPYIVGQNGGGAFIILYLLCYLLIGFPVLMSEILIGRTTQTSPSGAFKQLGRSCWGSAGKITILTGFFVSAFYSAVAGWILGYLVEAISGRASNFASAEAVIQHHEELMSSAWWGLSFHFCFILACIGVLFLGVRSGIERGNKIMMPMLFAILIFLAVQGLMMPNADAGLRFLLSPNWEALTPQAILIALGQAFFTLSLGQGTMVTYGSYLKRDENLIASCVPVVMMDTIVSLLSAVVIFTIVFSVGLEPDSGPGLIFHTLPWVFSQIAWGHGLAVMFFLLVMLAALTSEISALEPSIAYLIDEWGWKRSSAVAVCGLGAFLLGIPAALSYSVLKEYLIGGMSIINAMDYLATSILIPAGGLFAVLLVGWRWGIGNALIQLKTGAEQIFSRQPWISGYFWLCIKYVAPLLILAVFLNALGIL